MTDHTPSPLEVAEAADLLASALGQNGLAWAGAGHLTCHEVDDIARALVLLGKRQAAEELIHGHATEDSPGDRHTHLETEDQAREWVATL